MLSFPAPVVSPRIVALVLSALVWTTALAQNENETLGFRANHAYESGQFGENIDILSGNLVLSIPIGPRFQVNGRLGYQVKLTYNSKVWDYSEFNNGLVNISRWVQLNPGSPAGTGFSMHLGRITQDVHYTIDTDNATVMNLLWTWVTPDGGGHDIWSRGNLAPGAVQAPDPAEGDFITTDLTYTTAVRHQDGHFVVRTPDGLTYHLEHSVARLTPAGGEADWQNLYRKENLAYSGWYVTRIEDRSVPAAQDGSYPNVTVSYGIHAGIDDHVIRTITDSNGRSVEFKIGYIDANGLCHEETETDIATDRNLVVICRAILPAFAGTTAPVDSSTAEYRFKYRLSSVSVPYLTLPGTVTDVPHLLRIDYPSYEHPDDTDETYRMYFSYGIYGELNCRTPPISPPPSEANLECDDLVTTGVDEPVGYIYQYDYYAYEAVFLGGGWTAEIQTPDGSVGEPIQYDMSLGFYHIGRTGYAYHKQVAGGGTLEEASSYSRHVIQKYIINDGPTEPTWDYDRVGGSKTNAEQVTVTDASRNDTVYHFHASFKPVPSQIPGDDNHPGKHPSDGIAPEWNDGLLYRVEYFKGTGASRIRIRTVEKEYDADFDDSPTAQHLKYNARVSKETTIHNDAGGATSRVAYSNWDGIGRWRTVNETAFGVLGSRITTSDYRYVTTPVYVTGLPLSVEVHDGHTVLQRSDHSYSSAGRLETSVARKTVPPGIGRSHSLAAIAGDIKTVYSHSATTGAVIAKVISSKGDGQNADYCMDYAWSAGGAYLNVKTFKSCSSGVPLAWKAIDRDRDGNTGLVYAARDPALFLTGYEYDSQGRLTQITPPSPEHPTIIHYASPTKTTVTRNGGDAEDHIYEGYYYDGQGRIICEERRPAGPVTSNPYRVTRYDIAGRVSLRGYWQSSGSCETPNLIGETLEYRPTGGADDPFDRVARVTRDGFVTASVYQGNDITVTVNGVMGVGANGASGPVTTRYFRDGWNRLVGVLPQHDAAQGGSASAYYAYDLLDHLTGVELTDQRNNNTQWRSFQYDSLGNLFTATNPENGTVVYSEYDGLGNLKSVTDASGITMTYSYDAAGRRTITWRLKATEANKMMEWDMYDLGSTGAGKLTTATTFDEVFNSSITRTFTYSGTGATNGRLTSVTHKYPSVSATDPVLTVSYQYDNYGNVSGITYPEGPAGLGGGLQIQYDYSNGVPVSVREGATTLATVSYNAAGGVEDLWTLGGGKSDVAFDALSRPSSITIGKWQGSNWEGEPLRLGSYQYDGAGNIHEIGPNDNEDLLKYRYDAAGRLTEARHKYTGGPEYFQCFKYDGFGNLTGKVDRQGSAECSATPDLDSIFTMEAEQPDGSRLVTNRVLHEQVGPEGVVAFSYDARGNVLVDDGRRYRYDSLNRLAKVESIVAATATVLDLAHSYNGEGHRVVTRDQARDVLSVAVRDVEGQVLSEFRRTRHGTYRPEWFKHHVYLAGREVALRENQRPSPPGGLMLSTSQQSASSTVTLSWRVNVAEEGVTSYNVYRSMNGSAMSPLGTATAACVGAPTWICYADADLTTDARHDYQVTAVSSHGESYASDTLWALAGDVTAPLVPTCLRGTAGDQEIRLYWNPSTSTDVLGYNVYMAALFMVPPPGIPHYGPTVKVNPVPVRANAYTADRLNNGSLYRFWVRAVDHGGLSSGDVDNANCVPPVSAIFTASPKDYAPPAPPADLRASGDCAAGAGLVTWGPNVDSDQVAKYWVHRSPNFSPPGPVDAGLDPDQFPATSFTDPSAQAGTSYYYWVQAEDVNGNQSKSSMKVGLSPRSTLLPVVPGRPHLVPSDGRVDVRFKVPPNGIAISGFRIYRKLNADAACGGYALAGSINSSGRICAIGGATCQSDANCPGSSCIYSWPAEKLYVDESVDNNLAWDYVVATATASGEESGFSESSYAIPTAVPRDVHACIEKHTDYPFPQWQRGGFRQCSLGTEDYRRIVVEWTPPAVTPYHPRTASNVNGELGYLMGYHALSFQHRFDSEATTMRDESELREVPNNPYSWLVSDDMKRRCDITGNDCESPYHDNDVCDLTEACVSMGVCDLDQVIACNSDSQCVAGSWCRGTCEGAGGA